MIKKLNFIYFFLIFYSAQAQEASKEKYTLPEIPKNPNLTDSAQLKSQLEFIRNDIQSKIDRLEVLKGTYEKIKSEAQSEIKKIRDEKKLLEDTLQKEKAIKEERVSELVELLSKMEPRKAADMIVPMDKDLVVQLFKKLPQRQVTKVLESLPAGRATEFVEYYTRIRSGREYEILKELGLCQQPQQQSSKKEDKKEDKKDEKETKK